MIVFLHSRDMYIIKQIIWGSKLEVYHKNTDNMYLKNPCGRITPLDVYFSQIIKYTCNQSVLQQDALHI